MKFTIAVPSFQYGRFIRDCLRSVETQSYDNFEVLIADAGSTDGSLEVIAEFQERDPRFRLVSRSDSGHADAVARAFEMARGDVLGFLNADDLYMDHRVLETVAREFDEHPDAALVTGQGVYVDASNQVLRPVRLRYHPFDKIEWMKWRTAVLQPATFWRRKLMEDVSLRLDAEYLFDSWFFYDAWQRNYRFREIPIPLARYRLHEHNKSLEISANRIGELARFEDYKFGPDSVRGRYLRAVQRMVGRIDRLASARTLLKRAIYTTVNSISFLSAYRLPSI